MKLMRITCPFCDFTKDLPELPLKAQKATCPKCNKSFSLHENLTVIEQVTPINKPPIKSTQTKNHTKLADHIYCQKCGYSNGISHAMCCACGSVLETDSEANKLSTGAGCSFIVLFIFAFIWLMVVVLISGTAGDGAGHSKMMTRESIVAIAPLIFIFLFFLLAKSEK